MTHETTVGTLGQSQTTLQKLALAPGVATSSPSTSHFPDGPTPHPKTAERTSPRCELDDGTQAQSQVSRTQIPR